MTGAASGYGAGTRFRDALELMAEEEELCECGAVKDPDRIDLDGYAEHDYVLARRVSLWSNKGSVATFDDMSEPKEGEANCARSRFLAEAFLAGRNG